MRHLNRLVLFSFIAVALTGCASTTSQRGTTSADPNVILAAELAPYAEQPALQAIQRLRPQFLRSRGASSINRTSVDVIAVYLDATRMGGPEALNQVRASDLREIRYLGPADATQRYGLNHTSGAILLISR